MLPGEDWQISKHPAHLSSIVYIVSINSSIYWCPPWCPVAHASKTAERQWKSSSPRACSTKWHVCRTRQPPASPRNIAFSFKVNWSRSRRRWTIQAGEVAEVLIWFVFMLVSHFEAWQHILYVSESLWGLKTHIVSWISKITINHQNFSIDTPVSFPNVEQTT